MTTRLLLLKTCLHLLIWSKCLYFSPKTCTLHTKSITPETSRKLNIRSIHKLHFTWVLVLRKNEEKCLGLVEALKHSLLKWFRCLERKGESGMTRRLWKNMIDTVSVREQSL